MCYRIFFFVFINCSDDIIVEEVNENTPDYSEFFTTTIFLTRKALCDRVTKMGRMQNMMIIIDRSQYAEGQGLENAIATLTYERSGRYRLYKSVKRVAMDKFY